MASSDMGKDLVLIHARIFKHQAVLDGEAKYFIKEFESRRNNRESTRLEEVASSASLIDHTLSECCELTSRLQSLQAKVSKATKTANDIMNRERNDDEVRNENKVRRDVDWKMFLKEIETAKQDVERRHRERMNVLKSEKRHEKSPESTP